MKQQTTALVLSALLLSTLAHGPLESHNRAHRVEHTRHNPSHSLSHSFRDNSQQQCHWLCPEPGRGNESLTVVVNQTTSIISIVNTTASVAWAIDVNEHLVAIFNGSSGSAVVINIQEGSGVYISHKEVWNQSRQSWEIFINSISSLKVYLGIGVSFTKTTINEEVLRVIAGVLIHLSEEYAIQLQYSITTSYKLLLQVSSRISLLFKGSLNGLLSLVESTVVRIRLDILWFAAFLEGLGDFFTEIRGGIKLLIAKSVKLDLKAILVARSGVQVFVLIVTILLERNIDVGEVLGGVLSSGERLISFLVKLGGSVSVGITGFLKVVGAILGVIHKRIAIQVLIDVLINYGALITDGASLKEELTAALRSLVKLGEKINSSDSVDLCWSFVKKLSENKLVVNNIDITSVVAVLLTAGSISGLQLIAKTLILLSSVVKVEISLAYLVLGLIIHLNTAVGVGILRRLIAISISSSILAAGSGFLHLILKGVSAQAIKGIMKGDWSGVGVINVIYKSVTVAVKSASDGKVNFTEIFVSSETVRIREFIVNGLIAESKGSGHIEWDVSSESSTDPTIAVSEVTTTEGNNEIVSTTGGASDTTSESEVTGGNGGGEETTSQFEVTSEREVSWSSEGDHGHHDNGNHKGHKHGHKDGHKHGHGHHGKQGNDDDDDDDDDGDDDDDDRHHKGRHHGVEGHTKNQHHEDKHAKGKHHSLHGEKRHFKGKHHQSEKEHLHDKQHMA